MSKLKAGAAMADLTPWDSQFLYGYPHVQRYSTGVHDRLWSSALYMADEDSDAHMMFIANDIIYVSNAITGNIRQRISRGTGVSPESIMITATHTHSAPKTVDNLVRRRDSVVPDADQGYVRFVEDQIVMAGCEAFEKARSADIGMATADAVGIGTNRRDPDGPSDLQIPIVMVRTRQGENIACMLVCSMHPTVLHEDSKLVSADFPGMARLYLQEKILGRECPVLHHTGPAGNQSPRYVTRANTFDEAERIGRILGGAVEQSLDNMCFSNDIGLVASRVLLDDLPRSLAQPFEEASEKLDKAISSLDFLRRNGASRQQVRTAECDWFGAEAQVELAESAASGILRKAYEACLPAEIQLLKVGCWNFVGWPGEVFVEYALEIKKRCPDTFIISMANGELHGYIVTEDAYKEGGYEASGALFSWQTGCLLVDETLKLINKG